jgi:hypothetical protein
MPINRVFKYAAAWKVLPDYRGFPTAAMASYCQPECSRNSIEIFTAAARKGIE